MKPCSRELAGGASLERTGGTLSGHTSVHRARVIWDPSRDDHRAHMIGLAGQRLAASGAAVLGGEDEPAKRLSNRGRLREREESTHP